MTFLAVVLGLVLGSVAGYLAPLALLRKHSAAAGAGTSTIAGIRAGAFCLLVPSAVVAFFVGVPWGGGGGELLLGRSGIILGMLGGAAITMFLGVLLGTVAGGLLGLLWGQVFGTKGEALYLPKDQQQEK